MSRFAIFGAQDPSAIMPRLDPVSRERRIDPRAPVVEAYLGGRPVVLARMDPLTRRPGEPSDLTVPLTMSRYQHALDIERGYRASTWEPTPLAGPNATFAERAVWLGATVVVTGFFGALVGGAVGAVAGTVRGTGAGKGASKGAVIGGILGLPGLIALIALEKSAAALSRAPEKSP